MSKRFVLTTYYGTLIFFAVFFIWPILVTVSSAFFGGDDGFTLNYIFEVFLDRVYLGGMANALWVGIGSVLLSIVIAMPLSLLGNKYDFFGKKMLSAMVLLPLILPPFVGAIGIKQLLSQAGSLNALLMGIGLMDSAQPYDWLGNNKMFGIMLMNALHLYPILYLNISAAHANLDPAMVEAAENLGCRGWRRFFRITLPLIMPGIFAGGTIVFIWSFTELGVPLIFDFHRITSVQIFDGIKDIGGSPMPYALVVVMLAASLLLFGLSKKIFGRFNYAMSTRATRGYEMKKLSAKKNMAMFALFATVVFFAILPHIGVLLMSVSTDWYRTILPESFTLAHFETALGHELTISSISNSIKYATLATIFDIFLGVAIAYVVVRTNFRGRHILDSLAMLPLAVPGIIMAFGYLAVTREGSMLSFLIFADGDPVVILVIAYAVRRLPYIVRSAIAGFQQTNVIYEEAAMNLGASPSRTMLRVTLPLIMANLIAGALLTFSFAMLEVSDSLILAEQTSHFPITKAIYSLLSALGNGQFIASALGVWAMIFLATAIIGASLIIGKKMGALFRV